TDQAAAVTRIGAGDIIGLIFILIFGTIFTQIVRETASVVAPPAGQPTRSRDVVEGGSSPSPTVLATKTSTETVDLALKENIGDAPVCSNCGHMTIRNGSCYVCLTCGDTTGCS
ncbi:MAG: hypothetical protein L0Z63_10205, partial [Actinobacteria bacterium]|nr:hypothetical protein [Actinomycetota bacterium]